MRRTIKFSDIAWDHIVHLSLSLWVTAFWSIAEREILRALIAFNYYLIHTLRHIWLAEDAKRSVRH